MYNKKLLSKIDLGKSTKTNPYKKDIIYDPMGQWKYPGQPTRIPSSNITMKGVNYPVLAVTDNGQKKMMQPGKDYKFPGAKYVDEFPQAKKGGSLNSKKYTRSLDGIGSLFRESALFKKPKSSKKKLFHPKAKYYQDGGNTEGMTAMMKARLAYANQFGNPAAERMINLPDESYEFTGEEPNAGVPAGNIGTHFMGSVDNYAVPWIQQGPDGLFYNQNAGPEDLEAIRFDSDEDANYFAEHYKEVSPGFLNQKQNGGPFDQFTGDEPDPLDPHQVFLKNWYENRVFPKELEKARPTILSQFNQSFPPYVVTDKLPADALAAYNNMNNTVELNQNYPKDIQESSKTHELNHWATDTADEFLNEPHGYLIEDNIINPKNINTGSPESDTYTKDNFEYLVSPREVHSRIMTFRELAGFKPNQVITEKDVEDYFNKAGDTLDPDIKDLKNVTKGNKAMVELLNGMALNNTPISENNIQYTKKGGALNKFVEGGEPCDEGFKWNERTKRCEPLYYRPEFADPKKGLYAKFPKATPATIEDLNSYLPWAPFRNEEFDNYRLIGYNWNPDENNGLYPFREPPKGQIVYNRDTKEMVFQSDMGNKTYGEPTPLTEEQFNFWGQSEPAFQYPKNYGNVKDKNAPEKRLFYDPNSGHWYNANDHYKKGGALLTKKVTCKKCGWTWDAADGGNDMTTCHKCGGQGLIHAKKGGAYYDDSRNAWVEADGTVGPNGPSTYANGGALRQFVDGGNPCTDGQMWDEATQSCVSANETTTEEVGFDPIDMWAQDYEEKNPQGSYVYDKKKEYIKKSNRGLNRLAGVTLDNFPKEVEDQINEKYNYNMNSYITDRMGKVKKFNPKRRDEWIDELGPRSREVVANSKYGSKLQPSLWSRSLAGLATLASPFSPDIEAEVKASSLPGLTRKETNEIYNANYKGIPLGGLETFSAADIPGAVVANYLKNSKKDNPNIFSGELMSNVDATDAMAMNPIGLIGGIEGLASAGTKGIQLAGTGLKEGTTLLKSHPASWLKSPEERLVNPDLWKSLGHNTSGDPLGKFYNWKDIQALRKAQNKEFKLIDKLPIKPFEEGRGAAVAAIREKLGENSFRNVENRISKLANQRSLERSRLPVQPVRTESGSRVGGGQGQIFLNNLNPEEVIKLGVMPGKEGTLQALVDAGNKVKAEGIPGLENVALPTRAVSFGADPIAVTEAGLQFMPWIGKPLNAKNPIAMPFEYGEGSSLAKNKLLETVKGLDKENIGIDYYGQNNIMYDPASDSYKIVDLNYTQGPGTAWNWNKLDLPVQQRLESKFGKFSQPVSEQSQRIVNSSDNINRIVRKPEPVAKPNYGQQEFAFPTDAPMPSARLSNEEQMIEGMERARLAKNEEGTVLNPSVGVDKSRVIKSPDYYLDIMKMNKYNGKNKQYFIDLVESVKKQGNVASERQYDELQRILSGDYTRDKRGYAEVPTKLPGSPNAYNDVQKAGFLNPLAIADRIIPRLPYPSWYLGQQGSWNNISPLNIIPGYGKKLSNTAGQYPVGFRKFGNTLDDVKSSKTLRPKGGFRKGADQMAREGNWAEPGKVNENYVGVFEATMDPNIEGSNIKLTKKPNRYGIVGTTKEGDVAIPLTDAGLSFNRRLPFSNKYVPINKQKLLDNKFQLATQLPHVQSLIEKYGIAAGQALVFGYILGGKKLAEENLKTINKYTVDPVINWSKKEWDNLKKMTTDKKEGGPIEMDLTEDEVNAYREGGWIVEEID